MAREIITVPPALCRTTAFDWDIDWRTMPTPDSTAGLSQVVIAGFPRWVGTLPLVLPPWLIAQWRAVRAQARGRLGLYQLIMFDPMIPVPIDGQPWSNGETWGNGEPWAGIPLWTVTEAAPRGATRLLVAVPDPMPVPVAGQIVSHKDWPTIITEVLPAEDGYELTIARPLIAAAAVGDAVDLRPRGVFEAVTDSTGNPSFDLDRVARPVLELREYLAR